jgi:hypothetical protein
MAQTGVGSHEQRRKGMDAMSAFLRSRTGLVMLGFLAIAAFFLIVEHTAHFFGVLPFVLLLLCPLMHVFMHGGHGGHGGHRGHSGDAENGEPTEGGER